MASLYCWLVVLITGISAIFNFNCSILPFKCKDNNAMFTLNCKGKLLVIENALVMGIINATPDSFYKASRFINDKEILQQAEKMLKDGADILDIGGQSTRPKSKQIGEEEELKRVVHVIEFVHKNFPEAIISVDTYHAKVAKESVDAGASIINDISGGNADDEMINTIGKLNIPYICMHINGDVETMHKNHSYENVMKELLDFFINKITECKNAGINDVVIDPGFGFSKTVAQNFELLNNLAVFKMLEKPVLIGVSRKSTIYKTLGITADDALNGTTVLNTIALINGANILRVHDVKEAKEAVRLFTEYAK
jgi:dihydropteroate synthase